MRSFRSLLVLLVVLVMLPSVAPAAPTGRIVNGAAVDAARHDAMWPFIVSLSTDDGSGKYEHSCGGSLLSPTLVLTAAHCVDEGEPAAENVRSVPEWISIYAGASLLDTPKGAQRRAVRDVFLHPGWGVTTTAWHDDVAVLRLDKPVKFNARVQPARLVAPTEDAWWGAGAGRTDTAATGPWVAGWGNTLAWEPRHVSPNALQEVLVPIAPDPICAQVASPGLGGQGGGYDPADFLCAGALDHNADPADGSTGRDACSGDSGGPLVVGDGAGAWRIAGLVSHGISCAGVHHLAYVHVAAYRDWVATIASKHGAGPGGLKPVTRLRQTGATKSAVTIAWKPAKGAARYVVYGEDGEGGMQEWARTKGSTARITGIARNSSVTLWVLAKSKAGEESPMVRLDPTTRL